jgi:hypothetical protein
MELLVVIAIIGLLMAILMPALSRTKKQAQAVACTSSLKQWGCTVWLYTEDNDAKFPDGSGASADWLRVLRPYYVERGESSGQCTALAFGGIPLSNVDLLHRCVLPGKIRVLSREVDLMSECRTDFLLHFQ